MNARVVRASYFLEYRNDKRREAPRTISGANLEEYSGGIAKAAKLAEEESMSGASLHLPLVGKASISTRVLSRLAPSSVSVRSASSCSRSQRWRFATRSHAHSRMGFRLLCPFPMFSFPDTEKRGNYFARGLGIAEVTAETDRLVGGEDGRYSQSSRFDGRKEGWGLFLSRTED